LGRVEEEGKVDSKKGLMDRESATANKLCESQKVKKKKGEKEMNDLRGRPGPGKKNGHKKQ